MRLVFVWILFLFPLMAFAAEPATRVFQFSYAFEEADFSTGEAVDIYLPMPDSACFNSPFGGQC